MGTLSTIATFVATFYLVTSVESQITEIEANFENIMERLDHPKISLHLKAKFRDNHYENPATEPTVDIMIGFKGGNSKALKGFKEEPSFGLKENPIERGHRLERFVEHLESYTAAFQKDIKNFLKLHKYNFESLWATNQISLKGANAKIVREIADKFDDIVEVLRPVRQFKMPTLSKQPSSPLSSSSKLGKADGIPWNLEMIRARCPNITCLGKGIVVAIFDTGVLWTHIELMENYRGGNFSWFDPTNNTFVPTPCGDPDPKVECFHGTDTCGIAVGVNIGVAPEAQWIACKMLGSDVVETAFDQCFQWSLCPFNVYNPSEKNCSMAPHIINNSWGFAPGTGPENSTYDAVATWNKAGIVSIFSAGNDGPRCTTVDPPASYDISVAIGNVDRTRTVAFTSSRGPSLNTPAMGDLGSGTPSGGATSACTDNCHDSLLNVLTGNTDPVCTLTKPDLSAPGTNIYSSVTGVGENFNDTYASYTGTSLSAPMVSGAVALILCAKNQTQPNTRTNVTTIREILTSTASTQGIDLANGNPNNMDDPFNYAKSSHRLCDVAYDKCNCGFPNNLYGFGILDICAAVTKIKKLIAETPLQILTGLIG